MLALIRRFAVVAALLVVFLAPAAGAQEVNVYTTREPGLLKPLLAAFEAKSGIKVNTAFVKEGLAERVAAEGERSPADILMTVDIGNLVDLVAKGVTQPLPRLPAGQMAPAHLRDAAGHWTALSLRARLVYASKDRVKLTAISYEDLADPRWKGKICTRSGQHPYNTALVAAFIAHHGVEKAATWLNAVKANLARKPSGGDREVARDILAGLCDIGIGNSYYIGLMRSGRGGPDQEKWGAAVNALLPVFAGSGTHVNASGAALAKHAPNKEAAVKLIEFLLSDEGQALYAKANFEYPVRTGIAADPIIAALGELKPDPLPLAEIAKQRKTASELIDRVRFDD